MRTKQKWALTLLTALGAMSCGDSQAVDPYQSFIDGTALDAKFRPRTGCGARASNGSLNSALCYQEVKAWFNGEERPFYNVGFITKPATGDATFSAEAVKAISYDFPDGCVPGKEFDVRTDAYREDVQFPVFDTLPLATTSSSAPAVLPLVRVKDWNGVGQFACNAIKNDVSLTDGRFGGMAVENDNSIFLRAIVDPTYLPVTPSASAPQVVAPFGWHKGLLLAYLDGGRVPLQDNGNVRTMDGVWIKPTTSGAAATDPDARLVFQARPGEAAWSPVVRLREVTAASVTGTPTSLCYSTPCPADAIDLSRATTYTGTLFLATRPQ